MDLLEWPLKVTQAMHWLGTPFRLDQQGAKDSAFSGLSFCMKIIHNKASSVVNNLLASAGDTGNVALIPRSG